MERVLDVYKNPYNEDFPVVCMDESPKQLIEEVRPGSAMKPGQEARVDYEYIRHGVVNIFIANEPLKGKRFVEVTTSKTKIDWAIFVKRIADEWYPAAQKITLVMDNFKTHSASAFYETFEPDEAKRLWDRFEFVYTPKHGSWLNMAEIELHVLNGQCLSRHIPTIKKVYNIENFEQLAVINASPTFAHFRKSDKQIIDKAQVVAWFKLCEFRAKGLVVKEFNQAVKTELIKSLTEIFYKNQNTITALEATLAEAGIKLILQEKGEKMPIDGVSFWSNGNPAIGLSLRYKRIDWLAFTLFHELGHVFCHLVNNNQAVMIDLDNEDPDYKKSKEEMEANEFAQNYLIDPQVWNTFYQDYSYGDSKILSFSQSQKIHPGIILGRLCHMNGNFNMRTKVDKTIY